MNKLELIRRINNAIAELQNIREELTSEYPEIYHDMTMGQLLDGKAFENEH
jgi:vacuolar-type H+-ATPase subunit D/Vma8